LCVRALTLSDCEYECRHGVELVCAVRAVDTQMQVV
jgi:hypothetical protein